MELKDEREADVTREKLRSLELRYQKVNEDSEKDAHIQELTLRSLRSMINQMKEEIAQFESASSLAGEPFQRHDHEELNSITAIGSHA